MLTLQQYIDELQQMNRAVMQGYKAPHKPILLLSIMSLMECGIIKDNHILLSKELQSEFKHLWKVLVDGEIDDEGVFKVAEGLELTLKKKYPFKCSIENPFFHMQHESFWTLVKSDSWAEKHSYSIKNLQECYSYAELDSDLFELMKDTTSRESIRLCLLNMI